MPEFGFAQQFVPEDGLITLTLKRDDVPGFALTPRTEPCPDCGSNKVSWYFRSSADVPDNPGGVSCAKCGHEDMNLS